MKILSKKKCEEILKKLLQMKLFRLNTDCTIWKQKQKRQKIEQK